ncbi:hypothetical protein HYR99_06520 [Candidatus Poribacteria bacterium]|nr:hypothetical protein [Candidatus Poribacteria bacterium]
MIDIASLKSNVIFKKAFSQPDVFCQLVHDVLGTSIQVDHILQGYRYPEQVGHIDIELDLFAEDVNNRVVVQIVNAREVYYLNRFLYCHAIGLLQQMKSYRDVGFHKDLNYSFDRTVHTVVILTGVPCPEEEAVQFSVGTVHPDPISEVGRKVGFYPHRLVLLNPRIRNEGTPESVRPWLELIYDSLGEWVDETRYRPPIFQKVIETIRQDKMTPWELAQIKDERATSRGLTI